MDDELGRLGIERRPAGCAPTVGPLPPDELAVPAEERLGRDYERGPTLPAGRAARGGKERTIPVAKLRPVDRASEHLHLVTKDGVLELELCDDPTPGEQPDEAHEHEVRRRVGCYLPASIRAEASSGAPQAVRLVRRAKALSRTLISLVFHPRHHPPGGLPRMTMNP